jgi:hypothetical protein
MPILLDSAAYAYNSSTRETEAGLSVQGQLGLAFVVRPCLKTKQIKQNKTKQKQFPQA